jgi:hypothetical protein
MVDFCDALGLQLGRSETFQHAAALDHCRSDTERTIAREIHHDFEAVFAPTAVASSSMTRYLRSTRFSPSRADPASVHVS